MRFYLIPFEELLEIDELLVTSLSVLEFALFFLFLSIIMSLLLACCLLLALLLAPLLPPSPAVYVILTLSLILSGAVTTDDDDAVDDSSSHSGVGCMLIILLLPAPLVVFAMVAEVEDEVTGKHAMSPDVDSDAMDPNGSSLLELTYRLRASNGVTTRLLQNIQEKNNSIRLNFHIFICRVNVLHLQVA